VYGQYNAMKTFNYHSTLPAGQLGPKALSAAFVEGKIKLINKNGFV